MKLFDIIRKKKKEEYSIPQVWYEKGFVNPQDIVDATNLAYDNKQLLNSNVYIGYSEKGNTNICLVLDYDGKISNAFPINTNIDTYLKVKEMVKKQMPDHPHPDLIALAISIDYIGNLDLFNNKKNINTQTSLLNSTIVKDENMGDVIVVKVEGLGQFLLSYDFAKSLVDEIIKNM